MIYFQFLIDLYILPNNYEIPISLLIGFSIIIISFFYFFFNLKKFDNNSILLNFRFLGEKCFKLLLILMMVMVFFIKPVLFSEMIVDWKIITLSNYVRSFIFLAGSAFLPGACIYSTLLKKLNLPERFNIEPFFFKLAIYPLISFPFLGFVSLILDTLELPRDIFGEILLLIIILLFLLDFLKSKGKDKYEFTAIKISRNTLFIILLSIAVIIITLGIQFSVKYLLEGDSYIGINYASYIGESTTNPLDKFYSYTMYWGYVSFSLSQLCGIPAINVNVLLCPFIYLFISTLYLFIKALLSRFREKIAICSVLLIIIFSELFYVKNSLTAPGRESIALFLLDGILNFRYKSFALFLLIISLSLFIISSDFDSKSGRRQKILVLFISSWLLLQSIMIYSFTIIPAFSFIFFYCISSKNKKRDFSSFKIYWFYFILMFIIMDLMSTCLFSWKYTSYFSSFIGIEKPPLEDVLILNAFVIYSILLSSLFIIFLMNKIYLKYYFNRFVKYRKSHKLTTLIFVFFIGIFTILITLEVLFNILLNINIDFFFFYLHIVFLNIGIIGIIGIYSLQSIYKSKRRIFFNLFLWFIFFFCLASLLIFLRWFQYSSLPPFIIPADEYFYMMYWFNRIWQYSIIPLSIFASFGIVKFFENSKPINMVILRNIRLISKFFGLTILLFLTLSNTILAGFYWYNIPYKMKDDEIQILGWVEANLPRGTNIVVDRYNFNNRLDKIAFCNPYFLHLELDNALNHLGWEIKSTSEGDNCTIGSINDFGGFKNVTQIIDNDYENLASILIKFKTTYEYGFIEFNIRSTNSSKKFDLNFRDLENLSGFSIKIGNNSLYVSNETQYLNVGNIENSKWYKINIQFECTEGSYNGIPKYGFNLNINGTDFGNYTFINNVSSLKSILFSSNNFDSNYIVYLNQVKVYWEPSILDLLYNAHIIINYMIKQKFHYFILTLSNSYIKTRAEEKSINIYNILIENYFIPLYEYEELAIYACN